jgi:phage protein D
MQTLQQEAQQLQDDAQTGVVTAVAVLLDLPIVEPPELTPEKRGAPTSAYEYHLKIDGQDAPPELIDRIVELTVDDSLHLPDMFTIEIDDKNQEWMDAELFKIGGEIEIQANLVEGNGNVAAQNLLLKGEITALEPEFTEGASILMVRGYDYAYLMHRNRKSRSFLNIKDNEIAEKIAREAGLTPKTDPTPIVYDYVFQNNLTDLQFLVSRAQRIGYQVYVEEKNLHFCKYPANQTASPELQRGENLLSFQPRLTVVDQVDEVIVRGWDPQAKKEIVGRASSGPQQSALDGISETGAKLAAKAFKAKAQTVVVDRPVVNLNEANALAQALFDEINNGFIQGEGLCLGDPRVTAGHTIKITAVGQRFGGAYYVTSATHIFNAEIGYQTRFTISGRRPDIVSQLVESEHGNGYVPHRLTGVVVGVVTNNKDDELSRVKVKFPWLSDTEESYWVRVSQAGGIFSLPDINQEVLVAFEHGDIHSPYIIGVLWNGKDIPTKKSTKVVGSDGKVMHRSLLSNGGHELFLDDTPGSEQIVVRDKSGNEIVIDTPQNQMSINVKGNLKIDAKGNIDITGTGNVNIKGATINLN